VTNLSVVLHSLETDTKVELFVLDATVLGAGVHRWTTTATDTDLLWQGQSYPYAVVNATGFESNAQGTLPRPRIEVSNVGSVFTSLVRQYGDLLGSTVTRVRTFAKFLDNGSAPDPTAYLPPDVYVVDQKSSHTKNTIVWELTPFLDATGMQIPRRQVLRDTCLHTYRKWDGSAFVYTGVTCPYVGASYFKSDDTSTVTESLDNCSRLVTGCKLRFGATAELPTRAFPGVARYR
jgi:lambda family phage minor tail protein L